MAKKVKLVFIIITLLFGFFYLNNAYTFYTKGDNSLKFVYISDLNLYPTPFESQKEKHILEKQFGLLIYESQAVFQDIIRFLNEKLDLDLVVFGGNNISDASCNYNIWNLFQDMASEIKPKVLVVSGRNEINSQNQSELIKGLNFLGLNTKNIWWSYKAKNHLLIGLDSGLFIRDSFLSEGQILWLENLLSKNKNTKTVIFVHQSLLTQDGKEKENKYEKEIIKVIKSNPQVVLVFSGGENLNRIRLIGTTAYVINSSPIAYPCTFKLIELSREKLKIKTLKIPLKGVIKQAEKCLIESEKFRLLFPNSSKSIIKHVLGGKSDSNFELFYESLSNR